MAVTGQLGVEQSQPGNIQLGAAGIVGSIATSAGVATATGAAGSAGTAAGLAAVSGSSAFTQPGVGTSAGVGAAAGVSASTRASVATSAGVGAAAGVAPQVSSAVATSAGAATGLFIGTTAIPASPGISASGVGGLLSYGSQLYSYRKTVFGNAASEITDGTLGTYDSQDNLSVGGILDYPIDLATAQTPQFAAVFNHNFPAGTTVTLHGASNSSFSPIQFSQAMTWGQPNFWVDLRTLAVPSLRYWRVRVQVADPGTYRVGEVVVAAWTANVPYYQWDYEDQLVNVERVLGTTDYGVTARESQNFTLRRRTVRWVGPDSVHATLRAAARYVGTRGLPAIYVPDELSTDIWFLDWADGFQSTMLLDNRREMNALPLIEQSPGDLNT